MRQRYGFGPLDRVVLYAGTFSSYQGLDLLCDAFNIAAAKQPCMRLLCVGAGDEQIAAHWHDRIAPALRSRARFELRVPRQLMADHLALAACVISLRPLGENLPLKLFDYMASGKPIIATRGKAHGGLLNDQRAFLCDINAQSVASSIEAALSDLKLATRVGQQAQEYALRRFRWPRFVQFVEEIYEGVLEVNPGKLAQVAPGD
ncbi:MAG: glycosyltransferase [Steroidobacteraceae bacterium]